MPPIPVTSVLGYVGVFLLFLGVLLFLAGLGIVSISTLSITQGRKTWASGILLTLIGAACISPEVFVRITGAPVTTNVARLGSVTVSSVSSQANGCQTGDKAIDGIISGFPQNQCSEWASNGEKAGATIKVAFASTYQVNKVILFDRPNTADNILEGYLRFSDGTEVRTGALPKSGEGKVLTFPVKTVEWVEFVVERAEGSNIGLSEIEVYGVQ